MPDWIERASDPLSLMVEQSWDKVSKGLSAETKAEEGVWAEATITQADKIAPRAKEVNVLNFIVKRFK